MVGRILGSLVVLLLAVALGLLAWPQAVGLEQQPLVAQLVAMRGAMAAVALVAAVATTILALLIRPIRTFLAGLAALALAFAVANAAILGVRGAVGGPMPEALPGSITVLAWNTLGETTSAEQVADLVAETQADAVSLSESGHDYGAAVVSLLAERGIEMQQFSFAYDTVAKANSTTLLVSRSLGEYRADTSEPTTENRPSIVATPVNGLGPRIAAVHTTAPGMRDPGDWRTDLGWVAALCRGTNLIVAGDLNSTIDHWASLADPAVPGARIGGCVDAAEATGSAGVGTWPTALPALVGAPIDHVLSDASWTATGFRVIGSEDGSGSDHRPVVARFEPTQGRMTG